MKRGGGGVERQEGRKTMIFFGGGGLRCNDQSSKQASKRASERVLRGEWVWDGDFGGREMDGEKKIGCHMLYTVISPKKGGIR